MARHGMVATSEPLAAEAGVEILRRGGHAVDAAIAANAMLGLVEPMSCGLGGDLFAIVWDAAARRLVGLNASGRAPEGMTRNLFRARNLERIPLHGPLSWSVPGCVDGWFTLHERFGRLPFASLLDPTIAHAEGGFQVAPVIARSWARRRDLLAADPGAARTFLADGRTPAAGETVRNVDLARSLRAIAGDGRDAFYHGLIAERLVASSEAIGGLMTTEDLAAHASSWIDPVSIDYRGHAVWQLPPNTQGIAVLQMLRILEAFNLGRLRRLSADLLHLLIEAKKLAYEDRARHVADPAFADIPIDMLISERHATRLRERIHHRALKEIPLEDPGLRSVDTVYITAVDRERNAVSLIQSLYYPFGSGVVPAGTGFAIQNRGSLFSLDPDHANRLEPGKRPFHTIIPGFVTREGDPVFSFGVMGGDMQPQGQVQVLVNLLDFGMDVQAAGDAPRFRHDGSSTPTGDRMSDGGVVHLEQGFPSRTVEKLRSRGHRVEIAGPDDEGFGGYQGIRIDAQSGTLLGGTESRKDGRAVGY